MILVSVFQPKINRYQKKEAGPLWRRFEFSFHLDFENAVRQLQAVMQFQERFCRDPATGQFIGAYNSYKDLGQFEALLEEHLRRIIGRHIPAEVVGPSRPVPQSPVWDAGSPFRGLEVFDSEHELIFFGRTTAIGEVLAQIRSCAERVDEELSRKELAENSGDKMGSVIESDAQPGTDGNSSAPATFLLVSGMSGVGKSSLIRAGVLPLFAKEGVIEGVNLWRHAIFRPSDATGDLLEGFVRTIADAAVVPELAAGGASCCCQSRAFQPRW